jgi:hypothetical protein
MYIKKKMTKLKVSSQWHMPVIPALGKLRREDHLCSGVQEQPGNTRLSLKKKKLNIVP